MSLADSLKGFVEPPKPSVPRRVSQPKIAKPSQQGRAIGKSRDPQFQKLTVYVREETRKAVAIRLLQDGENMELSELVEQLLAVWSSRRSDV